MTYMSRGCGDHHDIESMDISGDECTTDVENIDEEILDEYYGLTVGLLNMRLYSNTK